MHIHARHHLFFMGKHKLWGKHLGIWDIDPKYVQPTKREIIILDRNQYSIWGNICTARCHKTCYSTFLMLESATSGSGTHQRLCLHSILQADWSLIWLHSKPVRNHVVTLVCAKPQRINPNEKKKCMWEQWYIRTSLCLPAKVACRHKRLKFSGNLCRVLDLTFSTYLAGGKSNEVYFHTTFFFSKILCYNDKRYIYVKPEKLDSHLFHRSSFKKTHRSSSLEHTTSV